MTLFFLIAKTILIIFFLVMFLRTNKPAWGIGLLTVTSAILLDTFLGTLGREQMLEELGYFFYIIAGALFAGATIWLWAVLKELAFSSNKVSEVVDASEVVGPDKGDSDTNLKEVIDNRQQIADRLRFDLSYENLLDLLFDLGWFDKDLDSLQGENDQFVNGIIALAEARDQVESLGSASERIVAPLPPEHLPRLEKLKEDTPPTLLRHFLVANYSMIEIERMIETLGIENDRGARTLKNSNVRYLLSDLYQNEGVGALIDLLQKSSTVD